MIRIKLCGLTRLEDVHHAVALGVDAVGFIFEPSSPRSVSSDQVKELTFDLPPFVKSVGVFVDESADVINHIARSCKLDLIQLHGHETPEYCKQIERPILKAIKIQDIDDINAIPKYQGMVSGVLLDTKSSTQHGGTGKTFDWGIALHAKDFDIPIILAGGINAGNVQKAVKLVNPYAIDISSGIELSPGIKDYNKMKEVVELART